MKRLFTIAIVAMIASLTFAQSPLARKKAASINKLERVADVKAMAQKAKEAKEMQAAMNEKVAAAQETSFSMLRKSTVKRGLFDSAEGRVINTWRLGQFRMALTGKPYKTAGRKTTAQEGNVTVTTDDHGIITDVTGVEPKMYQRAATGTTYYPSGEKVYQAKQSGMVTVVEDGDNVYINNPVTRYTTGAWVKGTKSGNTITVAARQPLYYNDSYDATVSLRWGLIDATAGKFLAADDHAEAFTFTVNGNVLTLEGTAAIGGVADAYYMGSFWDDDNSPTYYGDAETVLTYDPTYVAPSTELVTLPAGVGFTGWYMNGVSVSSSSETPIKNQSVNVAFVDNDVYVQGISADFPEAWVKGTIDGTTITFPKFQYVGQYKSSYDCWFIGVDASGENAVIKDAVATYDADAKTITFTDEVIINAAADRLYYLAWYSEVVVSAEKKEIIEPVITELTAELPYTNTFETEEEQAQAAIYDANNDESTFSFVEHTATGSKVARYRYSSSNNGDDYLVFPGVELKAGKKYKVSVDAASYSASYPERLEVVAGKIAKASQLTIPVIEPTVVATKDFITISNTEFTVEEDGTYFIAVHAISDADNFYLFVDNFSVSELDESAPATVSDLTVVADAQGANKADITFTVPAKTIGGADITEKVKVVVKRGEDAIFSMTTAAGTELEVADNNVPEAGYHTYSVVASYGEHIGEAAETKVYIGYDIPGAVEELTATDKSGSVGLTWTAPTEGANGFIVNPADFKYNVYPVEIVDFFGMQFPMTDYDNPYATGLTETSATVDYNSNEGEQGFTYFAVTTENTTGEGEDVYTAVVTGAPYEMPFFETVADGTLSYWWGYASNAANQTEESGLFIAKKGSDDAASFEMHAVAAGWINLQSGKIALAGKTNPVLTFDHAADAATPMTVSVITPKGEKEVATITAGADFTTATVSLAEFANEDWVRVIITGTFTAEGSAYLDRIRVYNQLDNNLAAKAITATSKVSAGDDVKISVDVENQGTKVAAAGAYTVDLYCNDAKVQSLAGKELASDSTTTFEFTEKTTVMSPSELVWKAVIVFADDADKSNDTTKTVKTTIKTTNYPAVTDLAGVQNGDAVSLTWSEPDMGDSSPVTVTDDFESYEGFTSQAGEWTFVDGDGAEVGGFQGTDFNVDGTPMIQSLRSFWVHDVSDGDTWNYTFDAHSGTKYIASMFRYDDGQVDDWAISPALSGNAQTVSFYAKSYSAEYPESIEVLYSTGSKNTKDFVVAKAASVVPGEWTEYTAELPAGAKYFAIRSCASSSFMLMIDDVTYETISGFGDLAIVGYNVYRDGVKLNAAPVAEPAYTDATATEGSHDYVVTVVYDKGESKISNIVTLNVKTGIDGIAGKAMRISTADKSIMVTNATGENVSVYTVDGKSVYNAAGTDMNSVKVESGVYIVKVGKTVVKTVVR